MSQKILTERVNKDVGQWHPNYWMHKRAEIAGSNIWGQLPYKCKVLKNQDIYSQQITLSFANRKVLNILLFFLFYVVSQIE